tara:strand:+ start:512 stop:823 length:312 start_codon:yes stop_codon:yes gene_type:complete
MTKYHATPTTVDGHRFASKREAKRYGELKLMVRTNEIEGLRLQPPYEIKINGMKVCKYIADFTYTDRTTGEAIVEDVKGVRTPLYNLKRKLMKAVHGIEVLET